MPVDCRCLLTFYIMRSSRPYSRAIRAMQIDGMKWFRLRRSTIFCGNDPRMGKKGGRIFYSI